MKRQINTEKAPAAVGPYSQAIEINNMLFVSGQVPLDPKTGKLVEGDISRQTEQVLLNISTILTAAGYSLQDVAKCTCYLQDMSDFQEMNKVYAKYFPLDPPARAAFQVGALPLGARVEIEAIAVK